MLQIQHTMQIVTAVMFAGLLWAGGPERVEANPYIWEGYEQRLAEPRYRARDRHAELYRMRNQTYRLMHGPAVDPMPVTQPRVAETPIIPVQDRRFRVRVPFLPPVDVEVRRRPTAPAVGAWDQRSYENVARTARQMAAHLRDIEGAVRRTFPQVLPDVTQAAHAAESLVHTAARRAPMPEVQTRFAEFDQHWHRLARQLEGQPAVGAPVLQRVEAIRQLDEALHQTLQMPVADVPAMVNYDRVRAAALTGQLVRQTSHLVRDVEFEMDRNQAARPLLRPAEWLDQDADALDDAVRQNLAHSTVVDEYEQFSDTWQRFVDRSRDARVGRHLRGVIDEIAGIDAELRQELLGESPVAGDRDEAVERAARLAGLADHLTEDLRHEIDRKDSPALLTAEHFARTAHDLHAAVQERPTPAAVRNELRATLSSWRQLIGQLDDLDRRRHRHSLRVANDIADELDHLRTLLAVR